MRCLVIIVEENTASQLLELRLSVGSPPDAPAPTRREIAHTDALAEALRKILKMTGSTEIPGKVQ